MVAKVSSGSQREMLSGDSVISGEIGTEVLSDGMCLGSMDVVALSSSVLFGSLLLCIFRVLLVSAFLSERYRSP